MGAIRPKHIHGGVSPEVVSESRFFGLHKGGTGKHQHIGQTRRSLVGEAEVALRPALRQQFADQAEHRHRRGQGVAEIVVIRGQHDRSPGSGWCGIGSPPSGDTPCGMERDGGPPPGRAASAGVMRLRSA